jgi:hypothetical protein
VQVFSAAAAAKRFWATSELLCGSLGCSGRLGPLRASHQVLTTARRLTNGGARAPLVFIYRPGTIPACSAPASYTEFANKSAFRLQKEPTGEATQYGMPWSIRMPDSQTKRPLVNFVAEDKVKHFAKDGPAWRLGALFIDKLPAILRNAAYVAAAIWGVHKLWP